MTYGRHKNIPNIVSRGGNIIGGGDWSRKAYPDIVKAKINQQY